MFTELGTLLAGLALCELLLFLFVLVLYFLEKSLEVIVLLLEFLGFFPAHFQTPLQAADFTRQVMFFFIELDGRN